MQCIEYALYYIYICDRLRENRAQRGMRRRRKKIDLVLKIVLTLSFLNCFDARGII